MPIVASHGREIRRLIAELADPEKRAASHRRLKALGARVVPHVDDELGRLDLETRRALAVALADVDTTDAKALRQRLARVESGPAPAPEGLRPIDRDGESHSLEALRALPPPRAKEKASISRERAEAHLALARAGSRLARKDLLDSLTTLSPERTRLYCEAAGLIGDGDFVRSLSRLATTQPEAITALRLIVRREKITHRSKVMKDLEGPLRDVVLAAISDA